MLAPVERRCQPLGELGPDARGAGGERVRQPEHGRAHDLDRRVRAGADQVVGDEGAVEGADVLGGTGTFFLAPTPVVIP